MKRPIVISLIFYIIGIIGGLYLGIVPFFIIFAFISAILFGTKKLKNKYFRLIRWKSNKYTVWLIIIFLLLGYMKISLEEYKYNSIYKEDEKIEGVGIIISDKKENNYNNTYKMRVIYNKDRKKNNTFLYIYIPKNLEIEYGDKINFKGKFIMPDIARNDGGFNYKNYLKTLKVFGTVKTNNVNIIKKGQIGKQFLLMKKLKEYFKANIRKISNDVNVQNILIGMIIGDTEELDDSIKEEFSKSNLLHILSVSGGQVSNIIMGLSFLLGCCRIHKKIIYSICIFILLVYMFITGLTASIVRASIMSIMQLISYILLKKYDIWNGIAITLFIILIKNPYSIYSLSVLLSYLGFLGILIGGKILKKNQIKNIFIKLTINTCFMAISAYIFIFPIIVYFFGNVSLTFIFTNLIVMPLASIATIGGFLFMLFPIGIFKFIEILIKFIIFISHFFSNIKLSRIFIIIPNKIVIILYYAFLLYFVSYIINNKKCKNIKLKLIVFFIILLVTSNLNFNKNFTINMLDVGQGDSLLISTNTQIKILIDGGGNEFATKFNVGEKTVLPYLLRHGIKKLDYIMISHFDSDHVEGLLYILKEIKVDTVIIGRQYQICENYKKFIEIINNKKIKLRIVEAGDKIKIGQDTYFYILWPQSSNVISNNSINNNSMVCKLVFKEFSMLYTGDIEEEAEKVILQRYGEKNTNILKSNFLKVAHHGSKTSSCVNFLKAVSPKYAVIGVGKNNKFGHPSDITIKNLKEIKSKIYRTDEHGEITIITDGYKTWIKTQI